MTVSLASTPRVLVLGGARSGKSRYAEALAEAGDAECVYIATAEAGDDEMRQRIAAHRERRSGRWQTVEAPADLDGAIARHAGPGIVLVVDCLTIWLSNLLLADADIDAATAGLLATLASPNRMVLVSNEVGLGIVPDNALARRFRDAAGRLNQQVAARADAVVFVAAGLPLVMKSEPSKDTG